MPNYEAMYFLTAAKLADAVETMEALLVTLKATQLEAEDMYLEDTRPCE